jgi:hypothetical protein
MVAAGGAAAAVWYVPVAMGLFDLLRRRRDDDLVDAPENGTRPLPDPAKVPTARGTWDQAALTNVDITEEVKRQLGTVTPPWKK